MAQAVKVKGLREFIRACDASSKEVKKGLRDRLRKAGRIVAEDAQRRFSKYDAGSAAGMRPVVRRAGLVVVQQRKGRVTGKRPDFGSLQMRKGFLPALEAKRDEVEHELEQMLDELDF